MNDTRRNTTRDHSEYNSTVFLCFLASFGICLVFLPAIPANPDMNFSQIDLHKTGLIVYILIMIPLTILAVRFICNQREQHESQVVFWPGRCLHCSDVIGGELRESLRQSHNDSPRRVSSPVSAGAASDIKGLSGSVSPEGEVSAIDPSQSSSLSFFVDTFTNSINS